MKKFMNDPKAFVEESLEGILTAYPEFLQSNPNDIKAIFRADIKNKNKVSIVTGGGFGHIPVFLGYVGEGLCDGVAVGNVFSTPGAKTIYLVTRSVPVKNGVLYIIGNYLGDRMNFEMAAEQAAENKIETRTVVVSDDVATAPRNEWRNRRCIGGIVLVYKIAGAAAKLGNALDEIVRILERTNENLASFGVAFAPCQLPGTSTPVFSIGEDEMEVGVGIHGEPGVRRTKIMTSREIAGLAVKTLAEDLSLQKDDRVAVLINGLGATPKEELFILYRDVEKHLETYGILAERKYIGEYSTSLGMSGASVSLLKLDDQTLELLDEPAYSPFVNFPGAKHEVNEE